MKKEIKITSNCLGCKKFSDSFLDYCNNSTLYCNELAEKSEKYLSKQVVDELRTPISSKITLSIDDSLTYNCGSSCLEDRILSSIQEALIDTTLMYNKDFFTDVDCTFCGIFTELAVPSSCIDCKFMQETVKRCQDSLNNRCKLIAKYMPELSNDSIECIITNGSEFYRRLRVYKNCNIDNVDCIKSNYCKVCTKLENTFEIVYLDLLSGKLSLIPLVVFK